MTKLFGALLLVFAALAAALGVLWAILDAGGTEWDVCSRGSDCIAGSTIGGGLIVLAVLVGVIGLALLRGARH